MKSVVVFIAITLSLFHVFHNSTTKEIINLKKEYKGLTLERDSLYNNYFDAFEKQKISKVEFLLLAKPLLKKYQHKFVLKNKEKRKLTEQFSFRGRSSFRFWVFIFGLVSALLFFSCKSLYNDIVHGSTYKFQFMSFVGITISFFWIIHLLFYTQKDFNKNTYVALILLCALLASVFTYFLVKYHTYKDDIILKQLSLLDRIKTIHYPRVALKALYAEKNDREMLCLDTVKENTTAFDNDLNITLKDI